MTRAVKEYSSVPIMHKQGWMRQSSTVCVEVAFIGVVVERMHSIYLDGARNQWDPESAIDWSVSVNYGGPIDLLNLKASISAGAPFKFRDDTMWRRFLWERQTWMVCQFLRGEEAALVAAGRILQSTVDLDARCFAATQAADEARHVVVLSRYLREHIFEPYGPNATFSGLVDSMLKEESWDVAALGMNILIEPLAFGCFRFASRIFHDDLIRRITALLMRDEARHVSFGVLLLRNQFAQLTDAERRYREEFAIEALRVLQERFLLAEVWERLGVTAERGGEFAASAPMLIEYQQTLFAAALTALQRVGMMTDRVHAACAKLRLLRSRVGRLPA